MSKCADTSLVRQLHMIRAPQFESNIVQDVDYLLGYICTYIIWSSI